MKKKKCKKCGCEIVYHAYDKIDDKPALCSKCEREEKNERIK